MKEVFLLNASTIPPHRGRGGAGGGGMITFPVLVAVQPCPTYYTSIPLLWLGLVCLVLARTGGMLCLVLMCLTSIIFLKKYQALVLICHSRRFVVQDECVGTGVSGISACVLEVAS